MIQGLPFAPSGAGGNRILCQFANRYVAKFLQKKIPEYSLYIFFLQRLKTKGILNRQICGLVCRRKRRFKSPRDDRPEIPNARSHPLVPRFAGNSYLSLNIRSFQTGRIRRNMPSVSARAHTPTHSAEQFTFGNEQWPA